jgi:hypothetical protein
MNHRTSILTAAAGILLVGILPARAASSTSSAVSDSSTTSVGSVSGSLGNSSNSSSKTTTAAEGDYKIIDIAAAPERPGMIRMTLQATGGRGADGEFLLYLPQAVAERTRLAQGGVVTARARPYGTEFAHGATPFFLVLSDAWYRELQTTAVQL